MAVPKSITLRAYNVGFGDCFLLKFAYSGSEERRILVDFGSTASPLHAKVSLADIASDIKKQCTGPDGKAKLHAVIATHRHRDHISGFTTPGTGDVIRALKPDVVIQPWTENPDAAPKARSAPLHASGGDRGAAFIGALQQMHAASGLAFHEAKGDASRRRFGQQLTNRLGFLGENNLLNPSAVKNLMTMTPKAGRFYVHFGSPSGLEKILPGVRTRVLGPPTVEQWDKIAAERTRDPDEFWHFTSYWGFQGKAAALAVSTKAGVFPPRFRSSEVPPRVRWFIKRADAIRGDQMLAMVRALDQAMNNTSVILLFQVGRMKLLFPGDAQIENWSFALGKAAIRKTLADVNLYKVGHHGSLNATPKTLWRGFTKKKGGVLHTVVSTRPGKHGDPHAGTEVPRKTLVAELKKHSHYVSTDELPAGHKMFAECHIDTRTGSIRWT
jgi:hypothetical protein